MRAASVALALFLLVHLDVVLKKDAVISPCGKYRYLLRRAWNDDKARALFIMLNPSTADAEIDDATIRSCLRIAKSWECGSIAVVNLMAWRATDPKNIPLMPSEAMGSGNPRAIEAALLHCDIVVCAWGAHQYAERFKGFVLDMIRLYNHVPQCLGKTKSGAPKHPLYIKSGTALELYQ